MKFKKVKISIVDILFYTVMIVLSCLGLIAIIWSIYYLISHGFSCKGHETNNDHVGLLICSIGFLFFFIVGVIAKIAKHNVEIEIYIPVFKEPEFNEDHPDWKYYQEFLKERNK